MCSTAAFVLEFVFREHCTITAAAVVIIVAVLTPVQTVRFCSTVSWHCCAGGAPLHATLLLCQTTSFRRFQRPHPHSSLYVLGSELGRLSSSSSSSSPDDCFIALVVSGGVGQLPRSPDQWKSVAIGAAAAAADL
jgi:hypothetical protein